MRGYIYRKQNGMFFKCHNCGEGTSIGNLIKRLDSSLYKEYVLERYKDGGGGRNTNVKLPVINIPSPKFDKLDTDITYENAERCDKLPDSHFCKQYIIKRKIPQEFFTKLYYTDNYKKFCDEVHPNHNKEITADKRLVIPFYDEYNSLIALSGRALEIADNKLRYVTIRTNESNEKLVYGLDRVNLKETVYIVEGPLDSLFIDNCIASGDANLELTSSQIKAFSKVLVFDNEPRNKEIVKMMQKAIISGNEIVIWPNNIVGKDINEMIQLGISSDEIQKIISNNTFKSLEAQTKFTYWKKIS